MRKHLFHIDRQKVTGIVSILLFAATGILLLARPQLMSDLGVWVLTGVLVVLGVVWLVRYIRQTPEEAAKSYDLAESLAAFSAAGVLFFRQDLFPLLLPLLWGALLVLGGFMLLQTAVDFLRFRYVRWWMLLIGASISIALGVLALGNPPFLAGRMPLFVGISLIAEAAVDLYSLVLMGLRSRGKLPTFSDSKKTVVPPPSPAQTAAGAPAQATAPAPEAPAATEKPAPAPEREAPATVMEELARMREEDAKKAEAAE